MIKNGNLPAMPITYEAEYPSSIGYEKRTEVEFGLTKREQFAMAAMQGLCATGQYVSFDHVAQDAVKAADELLAELERAK